MSAWYNGLSDDDRKEIFEDNCTAYSEDRIGMKEFVLCLAKLGYNATDIADLERQYRPPPPENEGD